MAQVRIYQGRCDLRALSDELKFCLFASPLITSCDLRALSDELKLDVEVVV